MFAQKTHNQKLINLTERARIIVAALEKSDITNDRKKQTALNKLANYASEVGIKVSGDQLDDYIESAVLFLRHLEPQPTIIDPRIPIDVKPQETVVELDADKFVKSLTTEMTKEVPVEGGQD